MNKRISRLLSRLMNQADAGEGGGAGGGGTILGGGAADSQGQGDQGQQGQQGAEDGGQGQGDGQQGQEGQGAADGADGQKKEGEEGQDGAKKDGDDKAAQVPEKYEIKTPEGFTVDPELMTEFEGIAKELKLPNDGAQKVADLAPKFAEKVLAKQAEAWAGQVAQWAKDVEADPEIGGDKFQATANDCGKALAAFGTPKLKEALESTGMGNHPELVRAFAKIGRAIGDDGIVRSGQGGGQRDAADVLYGKN